MAASGGSMKGGVASSGSGSSVTATVMRLGVRYERASQSRDFNTMTQIERQLRTIENDNPDLFVPGLATRGRNVVRRRTGQELINV